MIKKSNNNKIRVQLVYRAYRKIHPIYQSILDFPPKDVEYILPKVNTKLEKARAVYKKHRDKRIIKFAANKLDKYIFSSGKDIDVDLRHYISIVEDNIDKIPTNFVLEIEHAMALTKMDYHPESIDRLSEYLSHNKCRSVICLSEAAINSLRRMLGDKKFSTIEHKVNLVYPSSRVYDSRQADYSVIPSSKTTKLLFVGNDCYRKGLHELLVSFSNLPIQIKNMYQLYIVSNDADELVQKYSDTNIHLFKAKYSRNEIITKFFLPADFFVLPTKHDTFGMVLIDALSASTPVIATDQFAIPEIIKNEYNGLLLNIDYSVLNEKVVPTNDDRKITESPDVLDAGLVKSLNSVLIKLSKDVILQRKLKENANKLLMGNGKLSVKKRNETLRRIYEKAIN